MLTILVTGGAGFIGGCFVRQMLATVQGVRIVNLDKLTYAGNLDSLKSVKHDPRYTFVQGDISDRELLPQLLARHQPRWIVNFAAESHVDRSIDAPATFVETNVLGTFHLLEACRAYWSELPLEEQSHFRFLQISTDEVFGSLGAVGQFSPESRHRPNSPYSASKAAADHFVRAYFQTYNMPVLTTNCSNNYGPFQFPEKLVPLTILNSLEGKHLPVYGDGQHVRDWLFVEDHCRALRAVLEKGRPGQVYTIGGNAQRTNLDVVRGICRAVDELCPGLKHGPSWHLVKYVADRPGHDRRYAVDASKITEELGWRPGVTFEEGLKRTVRWYVENRTWAQRVASGVYQRERLGLKLYSQAA